MNQKSIDEIIKYCEENKACIHPPTKDVYDSLINYLENKGYCWIYELNSNNNYEVHKDKTVIVFHGNGKIGRGSIDLFTIMKYKIIELPITLDLYTVEQPKTAFIKDNKIDKVIVKFDEKEIILYSDNKTVMVAEYNGQQSCVNCNFEDDFDFKIMSNIAINQLMNKINKYKIKVGDIVEVRQLKENFKSQLIGLQGIVSHYTSNDYIAVKFPRSIDGSYLWDFLSYELRVIYKV